jgi:hypothetical protein
MRAQTERHRASRWNATVRAQIDGGRTIARQSAAFEQNWQHRDARRIGR